jgi:hypothetical protein
MRIDSASRPAVLTLEMFLHDWHIDLEQLQGALGLHLFALEPDVLARVEIGTALPPGLRDQHRGCDACMASGRLIEWMTFG